MTTALPAATDFTSASTQGAAKTAYANQRQFLADLLGTTGVAADARTALGLGSIATQAASSVAITGGAIDGTTLGATTRAAIKGTTIDASGDITGSGSLGLGVTLSATNKKTIEAGFNGVTLTGAATGTLHLSSNSYNVSGAQKYANTAATGLIVLSDDVFQYLKAGSGTAGSTITWSTVLATSAAGAFSVSGASNSSAGNLVASFQGSGGGLGVQIYEGVNGSSAAGSNTVMKVGQMTSTGRSIGAAGTINASGADLAEYRLTGDIRLPVAKGQVIGYQADGKVTDKWSLSVLQARWQIKTTNPHVVGGDTWGTEEIVGKRPVEPVFAKLTYDGPEQPQPPMDMPALVLPEQPPEPVRQNDEDDATFKVRLANWREESARVDARIVEARAAYSTLQAMHDQLVASYQDALRNWEQELQQFEARAEATRHTFDTITMAAYQNDLAAWEARLEAQRQTVDRIAYNGEVPMLTGKDKPKKAGDRVVPIEGPDDTIDVKFVDPGEIEFRDYVRCCGTVTSVREDGTCIVAVKVG